MRTESSRKVKIKIPAIKPHIRTPIKPVQRHRDDKNDYVRTPKHKKPIDDIDH